MIIKDDVRSAIKNNIQLIEEKKWIQLYEILADGAIDLESKVNTVLLEAGINPLEDLNQVPRLFLIWSPIENVTIPINIEKIQSVAFTYSKIKEITLPKYLQEIGEQAFAECNNLEKVVIPDETYRIRESAFFGCRELKQVVIGSGMRYIANSAFALCNKLTDVYYKGSEEDWNKINMSASSFPYNEDTEEYYCRIHFDYTGE